MNKIKNQIKKDKYNMPNYFKNDDLCKCCDTNTKNTNQIVCDECHSECMPCWIEGE